MNTRNTKFAVYLRDRVYLGLTGGAIAVAVKVVVVRADNLDGSGVFGAVPDPPSQS